MRLSSNRISTSTPVSRKAPKLVLAILAVAALAWVAVAPMTGSADDAQATSPDAAERSPDVSTARVPGACCLPDGACQVVEEGQCLQFEGTYLGEDVGCDPMPCLITPSQETTWGKLKAEYRETAATR